MKVNEKDLEQVTGGLFPGDGEQDGKRWYMRCTRCGKEFEVVSIAKVVCPHCNGLNPCGEIYTKETE